MTTQTIKTVYHLFPLGAIGNREVESLEEWIPQALRLGCNTLLLGPVWDCSAHGYDIRDYDKIHPNLGNKQRLAAVLAKWKRAGFGILFDAVLNHCGRNFPPFVDLCKHKEQSMYKDWFKEIDFNGNTPCQDGFSYMAWNGCYDLVTFNHANPELRAYLFNAVRLWIEDFDIDGLRLDAADVIDTSFLAELASFCKNKRPEFWLMGEMVHGDYRKLLQNARLDSVTNYEMHKGFWSSCNDGNLFEIAWSMERQFGKQGVYRGSNLLQFLDNHDVMRIGSQLSNRAHLWPLHILLFTVPGIPAIYYGSEVGWLGEKTRDSDQALRPALIPANLAEGPYPELQEFIAKLARIRERTSFLTSDCVNNLKVCAQQFAFAREDSAGNLGGIVAINLAAEKVMLPIVIPREQRHPGRHWVDLLDPSESYCEGDDGFCIRMNPCFGCILAPSASSEQLC